MNSLDLKFEELRDKNEKALACFLTGGDPDVNSSMELVKTMEKAGADIIEIGIPYSDPLADGPTIQNAAERALKSGVNIPKIMNMVSELRNHCDVKVPLVYLLYYNSIFKYGIEKFVNQCSEVGIEGLIVPDVPVEEREQLFNICLRKDVYLIPLVAPTSEERIEKITKDSQGFVYCVSVNGITGTRESINTDIEQYMKLVDSYASIPKLIGFGISDVNTVRKMKNYSDGVIIGSAIVKKIARINEDKSNFEDIKREVYDFIREIKEELRR